MKNLLKRLFPPPKPRFVKGHRIRIKIARFAFRAGANKEHQKVWIESHYILKYENETEDNYLFTVWLNADSGSLKSGDLVYISKVSFENLKYKEL